ncbi:putative c6 zinc finger domain protein [Botrytis cinerea BcDW1]|uniref:Putative c6 zinc finger domain protein n=1 Tax=Botryotinia fuckeliana (strain BcDW1) TaxID=1290391 RepID=M7UPA6_BOTF1|nr:putative c6 zinc finger domain protein [Botrytis cinerea BcDW1]
MADATETGNRVRQRRASRPKVKTGCNNCKNANNTLPIAPRPSNAGLESHSTPANNTIITTTLPGSTALIPRKTSRIISKSRSIGPLSPTTPSAITSIEIDSEIFRPPTLGLPFDAKEGQYFQVFRTHTASELSGFFDSEFWTRSVLQESHSEASIRHAVVALGALYKTLEKVAESPPTSPTPSSNQGPSSNDSAPTHWSFAWEQYGKAVTRMRQSISNNEVQSQRTVLISSVLFTCFQSFVGDHKAAIRQVQVGLGVMEKQRRERKKSYIQREDDIVEEELGQMFTRMAIQAKSYDMAFHFPAPWVIRLSTNPSIANPVASQSGPPSPSTTSSPTNLDWRHHVSRDPSLANPPSPSDSSTGTTASIEAPIPESFPSIQEARLVLDALCERIMRYNEELVGFYTVSNNILPASIKSNGYGFGRSLEQWQMTFAPILAKRRAPGTSNIERAGIIVLQMTCVMTRILVFTAFSANEMDFDQFLPKFTEINELAKELIVDEELALAQARCGAACKHVNSSPGIKRGMRTPFGVKVTSSSSSPGPDGNHSHETYSHIKPSFALDLGIIPPLFVVATKSRDRRLRREAISLLTSSHRREGMWDSRLCAGVGNWIMNVEEEGLDPYVKGEESEKQLVPDEKRVMVMEMWFNLERRWAMLRCGTRGAKKGDYDARARETPVSW